MALTILDVSFVLAAVVAARWLYTRSQNKHNYPPGPKALPIIGNYRDMPTKDVHIVYRDWSRQYDSDLIYLNMFGTDVVIVNSLEVATDLFDKRSSIYNDRPHTAMLHDLIGLGWSMAFITYGDRWRDMRKAAHQSFSPEGVKLFNETETQAAQELVRRLVKEPDGYLDHARHMAGQVIMRSAYGIDVQPHDDPYIEIGEKSLQALCASAHAGAYLVDYLPFLKYVPEWFPGANFQIEAKNWRPYVKGMLNKPFELVRQRIAEGTVAECAATRLLDTLDDYDNKAYTESVFRSALGSMYAGGADTTVSALGTFILAMLLHPDVQRRAQEQLDSVVGNGRLPDFSDRPSLPFIDAILNECLRWQPVVSIDIPHRLTKDDVYNGYFMPKGTIIFANCWAILHDEKVYPNPSQFNPDRFMLDGELNPNVRDPKSTAVFGFGRRVCPGRFMAEDSAWISMATILSTLNIKPALGKDGKPIIPEVEYDQGLVAYPKPFPVDIRPRSPEHAALVAEVAQQ